VYLIYGKAGVAEYSDARAIVRHAAFGDQARGRSSIPAGRGSLRT
jgi:hypothetical protein